MDGLKSSSGHTRKIGVRRIALATSALACLGMANCTFLPAQGPSAADIVSAPTNGRSIPYAVVEINPATLNALKLRGFERLALSFPDKRLPPEPLISIGDVVMVTIWEASPGGLFSAPLLQGRISTGSNSATLPEQVVTREGEITVPYAGNVRVAGRTSREVQSILEAALKSKAIQPQVLVNVTHSVTNSATVGGEVTNGARVPLSVKGDRLLDVLAGAGGVRAPINETFVELTRGARTLRVPLTQVISHPSENIYIRPGDTLNFVRDPQTFVVYGAAGRNAEVPFDADGISLAQAIGKGGGLIDERSDPAGVFIYRSEVPSVAEALKPPGVTIAPDHPTPVIYHLDLRDPEGLFFAQKFRVANRDLIYIADSPSTNVQKVFAIIAGGTNALGAGASIASVAIK